MNLLPGWLVSAITSRRVPPRREQDLADMGTAFGLDASMADDFDLPAPPPSQAAPAKSSKDRKRNRSD
jgi:hypothetical protein